MSTLFENIVIPIKVGDTVLGGKFKNKRIVVKDIGKNEKGDITINGRPLLKYRMVVDELVQVDLDPINEAKFYITRNLGRGQGKSLVGGYDLKRDKKLPPKVFKSYKDAQKEVERLERGGSMGGQMTAYYVTDKNMNPIKESVNEGRPFPMDTPNEFTYMDFKKYAYRKRGMFKKELLKAKGDSSRMFQILSGLWYSWAKKNAPSFTRITNTLKFGRALMVMMVKDNLVFDRDNWKKTNKITKIQEIFYDNLGNPCSGNVTMDGRCIADEVDDRPLEEGVGLNKSLHKGIGPDGGDDLHEVGVFPVTNYISGIIPQGRLDTNTPENKKKSIKLVKDLTNTLNKFWKEHDIPFRIK